MSFLDDRFCSCPTSRFKDITEDCQLKDLLPVSFQYNLCNIEQKEDGFIARFRVNITDKETALKWLEEFTFSSNTTFRTDKVYPQNTVGNIYKVSKYCHHRSKSTKDMKANSKNTNCSARLVLTVKQTKLYRNNKSKDVHLQDFPTIIVLRHTHNHLLNSAAALRYRNPNKEVCETYTKMFKAGYTPAKAFHVFVEELQESHGDDYHIISADRSLNPDIQWVYNRYYKLFKTEYGDSSGKNMMNSLKSFIENYNEEQGGTFIKNEINENGDYTIVAVTPLMKRIMCHVPEAEEIIFCDATSYVDRFGTKTFQILINSSCGGLPIAVFLTSSEDEPSFIKCLEFFKELIDEAAFGGRGKLGPKLIMTDDDRVEQNGFSKIFPEAEQLLCIFHILQSCWRYLCSSKSGVSIDDRQEIFFLIKKLLYSETEEEYLVTFSNLTSMSSIAKSTALNQYLHNLNKRKHKWALYFRQDKILRGQNTNNISEAAVKVLKDRILQRTKAYSVVQLLDFLVSDMNNYYIRKIISIVNGRIPPHLTSRYNFDKEKLKHLEVKEMSSNLFEVINVKTEMKYVVDTHLDLCSCYAGKSGQICKHLQKISIVCKKDLRLCPPKGEKDRSNLLYIALGKVTVPEKWFEPLQTSTSEMVHENEAAATHDSLLNEPQEFHVTIENSANEVNTYPDTPEVQKAITDFENISKEIVESVKNDENMFESFTKFIKNYKNIKTKTALNSAMATFGKYSGFSHGKKMKLSATKRIGVQPTAIARRKTSFGGRLALQSGRPTKKARISEHAYALVKSNANSLMPKKKVKRKAPHSIAACTEENITLGKKH